MNSKIKNLFLIICIISIIFLAMSASAYAGDIYGCPWNANSLSNIKLQSSSTYVTYRFRAKYSAYADKVTWWNVSKTPNYGLGTGGIITCELQTNNSSNLPSGTVLATAILTDPMGGPFQMLDFDYTPYLAAGTLYHLVFNNIDSNPAENFTSLDLLYFQPSYIPNQPGISDLHLGAYKKVGTGGWVRKNNHTPVYTIIYTNGKHQGQSYMDVWKSTPGYVKLTSTLNYRVRETIKSESSKTIKVLWVRVKKVGSPGNLKFNLTNSSGTILAYGARSFISDGTFQWIKFTVLPSTYTLSANTQYYLVFKSASSAGDDDYYLFHVLQQGNGYGLSTDNLFTDGHAQYSLDGGSSWLKFRNKTTADLQFYFELQ